MSYLPLRLNMQEDIEAENSPSSPIVDKLPIAVFEYTLFPDEKKDFTYISPYCEILFGVSSAELMAGHLSMFSFIHPEERETFIIQYNKIIASIRPFNWKGRIVQPNGKIKWIRAIGNPAKLKDGRIVWTGIFTNITKKKKIEQAHREIKERLEHTLKGSELGIWDYNYKTNTTTINDHWAKIVGYQKAELEEMLYHYQDFIHLDDRPKYTDAISIHLTGKTDFYEVVYRFLLKDGSWRWIMERGHVVERDEVGNVIRTVGTLQDFEKRKTEEQIAKETESKYSALLESLPLGICIHQNGTLVYANSHAAKIIGAQSVDEIIDKPVLDFVHPDYKTLVVKRMQGLMAGKPALTVEEKFIRLDGEVIIVETSAVPIQFKNKPAVQLIVKDVTAEKEAKLATRKSETLFTQLFHNSPFGKVMLDETGKVVLINDGFEKMFGYTRQELVGNVLNQFIVPHDLKEEGNDLDSLISAKQVIRIDTFRTKKDGTKMSVIVYGVPIQLEDKTIGIFGSYVDITEQKKTEEELKIRNAELDNFVYKVSHDLRAPLSSVLGLVNLAQLDGNDDSLDEYIKIIGQKVTHLDHFISDVLSHSKNLKLDIKIEPIDLQKLIEKTFTDLNYLKDVNQIKKIIEVNGADFYSDPWRIGEIFRNLISNAIKYRNLGCLNSEINIKIDITQDRANVVFSDNGIGIDKVSLTKIFDMFYRASEQSDGSGLGLYIVKNAVDKLGGILKVSSELHKGTKFEIKLPNHILVASI